MAKARFVYQNLALASEFSASSAVSNRPASFLANHARWKKWRSSTGTGDQYVVAEFASARVQAIALVDWAAHTGGSISADTWDGASWVPFGSFTLPAFNPTGVVVLWDVVGVVTTKIRIYWTNTTAASEYVELGALVFGSYYQPTYTVIDGFRITPVDPSLIVSSIGGQEEAQERRGYHVIEGTFETEPEADHTEFRRMNAAVGRRVPVLAAVDPEDVDETFYARVDEFDLQHVYGDNWTIPVRLVEAR